MLSYNNYDVSGYQQSFLEIVEAFENWHVTVYKFSANLVKFIDGISSIGSDPWYVFQVMVQSQRCLSITLRSLESSTTSRYLNHRPCQWNIRTVHQNVQRHNRNPPYGISCPAIPHPGLDIVKEQDVVLKIKY